ncbi:hypothetical protein BKA61DRAFT_641548 [Leptodontidium sp. MPI-SDFR-AT-0119]|nr:hypothetical protein BKA61DRAFT_641548 [Leptodontidium sp. MPI-SDFR-AT-0119]
MKKPVPGFAPVALLLALQRLYGGFEFHHPFVWQLYYPPLPTSAGGGHTSVASSAVTVLPDKRAKALSLIESAKLPHPSGPLLSSFIIEALNPRFAAQYVLQTCRPGHSQQTCLLQIVSDWSYLVESISKHACAPPVPDAVTQAVITKRDGGKCCITGKASRFWDPLIVVPVLPVPARWLNDEPQIFKMLGAFFTPSYRDWWLAYAQIPGDMSPYHNHWLVRKSAANAFAQGVVKLDRLHPSMVEYEVKHVSIGTLGSIDLDGSYPLLGDHSRRNIEKVDPRFLGTHARLSPSYRWLAISKQISLNMEAQPCLPRARANNSTTNLQHSQKGPFFFSGLMKTACLAVWLMAPDKVRVAAYKILRKVGHRIYGKPNAHEPVQRLPFGLYLKYSGDPEGFRNEFNALKIEYLTQIRAVPKAVSLEHIICDTLGGSFRDPRISDRNPVRPFADEAAFNQVLRNPDDPSRKGHKTVFTHADLNPHYTKAFFEGFRCNQRWRDFIHEIFRPFGNYLKEFEIEKRSWEEGDYI